MNAWSYTSTTCFARCLITYEGKFTFMFILHWYTNTRNLKQTNMLQHILIHFGKSVAVLLTSTLFLLKVVNTLLRKSPNILPGHVTPSRRILLPKMDHHLPLTPLLNSNMPTLVPLFCPLLGSKYVTSLSIACLLLQHEGCCLYSVLRNYWCRQYVIWSFHSGEC